MTREHQKNAINSDPGPQRSLAGCSSTSETTTLPNPGCDFPDRVPPTTPPTVSNCTASATAAPVACATLPITDPHATSATSATLPNANVPAAMFSSHPTADPQMSNVSLQQLLLLQAIQERHEQLQSQLLSSQTKQPENGCSELPETDHRLSTTIGLDGNESPPPDDDSDQEGAESSQVCNVK